LHTVSLVHDRSPPQRYALSLHDALPISPPTPGSVASGSPHLSVQASSRVAGPGCPTTVEPLRFGSPSRRRPLPVRHFLPGLCVHSAQFVTRAFALSMGREDETRRADGRHRQNGDLTERVE